MSDSNLRGQGDSFVKEKQVLEPEASGEDNVKRSQSGRKIGEKNLSLRECQSAETPLKKVKHRKINRLETRRLKVPQIPEKIVDLVNILQHENFLKVVDQFFKPAVNKQSRKKSQPKTSVATEETDCKSAVPYSLDFESNSV